MPEYDVVYAVSLQETSQQALVGALKLAAKALDQRPKELRCLLAEPDGDVQWFTFAASSLGRNRHLDEDFFREQLAPGVETLVVQARDHVAPSDLKVRVFRQGSRVLEVRSDAQDVMVVHGAIAPTIARAGDAAEIVLRTLGWPSRPVWEQIGAPQGREVVLMRDRALVGRPAIRKRDSKLPGVKVHRRHELHDLAWWGDRSTERFPLRRPGESLPAKVKAVVEAARAEWPALASLSRGDGSKRVADHVARIRALTWDDGVAGWHVHSRQALMREFLRRSALWSEILRCPERWPFFDIAGAHDADAPAPALPPDLVPAAESPQVRDSLAWLLRWEARFPGLAELAPKTQCDLLQPYTPLLFFYQRGGGFAVVDNTIDLGGPLVRLDRGEYLRAFASVSATPSALDELDS